CDRPNVPPSRSTSAFRRVGSNAKSSTLATETPSRLAPAGYQTPGSCRKSNRRAENEARPDTDAHPAQCLFANVSVRSTIPFPSRGGLRIRASGGLCHQRLRPSFQETYRFARRTLARAPSRPSVDRQRFV